MAHAVVVAADNTQIEAGTSGGDFALLAYDPNLAKAVAAFGPGGQVLTDLGGDDQWACGGRRLSQLLSQRANLRVPTSADTELTSGYRKVL